MTTILALDPGHALGYAVDDPEAPNGVRTGIAHLPEGDTGPAYVFLADWLALMIEHYDVGVIAWELQLHFASPGMGGNTNLESIGFLHGVCAVAELVAAQRRLECWRVPSSTARLHFTGSGKGKGAKRRVLERARELGYEVKGFDAADALAIWDVVAHEIRHPGVIAGPLFGKAS